MSHNELALEDHAEIALKEAARKLKLDHARRGLPLYIWQDGKVVQVSAEQLRAQGSVIVSICPNQKTVITSVARDLLSLGGRQKADSSLRS